MSVDRFLKQRAVNIVCEGSYMLHRWYDSQGKLRTLACRTTPATDFAVKFVEKQALNDLSRLIVRHDDEVAEAPPRRAMARP